MFAYIKREYALAHGLPRTIDGKEAKLVLESAGFDWLSFKIKPLRMYSFINIEFIVSTLCFKRHKKYEFLQGWRILKYNNS